MPDNTIKNSGTFIDNPQIIYIMVVNIYTKKCIDINVEERLSFMKAIKMCFINQSF